MWRPEPTQKNGAKPKSLMSRKQIVTFMKNFNLLLLAIFLSSAFLFSSCNNLSRGKAKKIVLSKIEKDGLYINLAHQRNGRISKSRNYASEQSLNKLIDKGYVTLDNDNEHITLANKVRPYTKTKGIDPYHQITYIYVANFKDINITGIKGNDNHKRVEYQEIFELNALGKEINWHGGLFRNQHIDLQKYDDGWR
jgi:hypothetical protein